MESIITSPSLTTKEFKAFQDWVYETIGISLSDSKHALIAGRLAKRLRFTGIKSYGEYFRFITSEAGIDERKHAIDRITTNETWFFREDRHFHFLKDFAQKYKEDRELKVWCAASSSGEEPYSICMTLADGMGRKPWSVMASDVSTRVLERARAGVYPLQRVDAFPPGYMQRFCLKGTGAHEGKFMVNKEIQSKVTFKQVNLIEKLPDVGKFDMIWLRNCLIYFDVETKRKIFTELAKKLVPGGLILLGHSENASGLMEDITTVQTSVYKIKGG